MPCRILILISGNGSNLQAIIDAQQAKTLNGEIVGVMSNVPSAYGITRAENVGIPTRIVDHKSFADRESFDAALLLEMQQFQPDLVVLAGFMRVLGNNVVHHFLGKMLNIHPSLLPKYPGLNTHQRALDAGDKVHGATVHFVTPELDGGPAIAQSMCPIFDEDTEESLADRVHALEHVLYPAVIAWYASNRLIFSGGQTFLDKQLLTCPIQL